LGFALRKSAINPLFGQIEHLKMMVYEKFVALFCDCRAQARVMINRHVGAFA
jgi:hypothetical protein